MLPERHCSPFSTARASPEDQTTRDVMIGRASVSTRWDSYSRPCRLPMHTSSPSPAFRTYSRGSGSPPIVVREPSSNTPDVPEALVQDLWAQQRFDTSDLQTTDDARVHVLAPGTPNTDAGPDFRNAHVRLGGVDWRGHVEVHLTSQGWFEHKHHTDPRYDSVVLHVTLHADMWTGGLLRADGSSLPEVVLYPRLESPLRKLLHAFHTRTDDDALPCAPRWDDVPPPTRQEWIRHLARVRLARKRDQLPVFKEGEEGGLDYALHERLFAGLGYAKNDGPMSTLARRIPPGALRSLRKSRSREALLLGTAGLLPEPGDLLDADRATADYAMDLRDRFRRLQVRRDLSPMPQTAWTFFRLRPPNFPPLRIAQAAAWYADGALMADAPIATLREALHANRCSAALRSALRATPSDFWRTHYHLTKAAAEHTAGIGDTRINTLLVNAVAPVLLRAAERRDSASCTEAVYALLNALPAPRDKVVRHFQTLGTAVDSAFGAQGLHELYRRYCTEGGCLDCDIGQTLLGHA